MVYVHPPLYLCTGLDREERRQEVEERGSEGSVPLISHLTGVMVRHAGTQRRTEKRRAASAESKPSLPFSDPGTAVELPGRNVEHCINILINSRLTRAFSALLPES